MAHDDELLMVRAADTDPHVQEAFAAGALDRLAEVAVLLGAESKAVQVRTPDQSLHDDAAPAGGGEEIGDPRTAGVEFLIRVTSPVREENEVALPRTR
jgi:hypothetical protein